MTGDDLSRERLRSSRPSLPHQRGLRVLPPARRATRKRQLAMTAPVFCPPNWPLYRTIGYARHCVSPRRVTTMLGTTARADSRVSARTSSAMSPGSIMSAGSIRSRTHELISVST